MQYVEREEVLAICRKHFARCLVSSVESQQVMEAIKRDIEDLPAGTFVQLKHAEWQPHIDGSGTCTCCNITQKNVWDFDNWQYYCGHCGAKMTGILF